jgi:hypothetical protein
MKRNYARSRTDIDAGGERCADRLAPGAYVVVCDPSRELQEFGRQRRLVVEHVLDRPNLEVNFDLGITNDHSAEFLSSERNENAATDGCRIGERIRDGIRECPLERKRKRDLDVPRGLRHFRPSFEQLPRTRERSRPRLL